MKVEDVENLRFAGGVTESGDSPSDMMGGRCLSKQCRKMVDDSWWCRLFGWSQLLNVTGVANDRQYSAVAGAEGE